MKQLHRIVLTATCAVLAAFLTQPNGTWASSGTDAFDRGMQPVLASYLTIHDQLAKDSMNGVQEAAATLHSAASKLDAARVTGEHALHYKDVPANLRRSSEALRAATDIEAAREAFKLLSRPMVMWATMSRPDGIDVVFCAMAQGGWLQKHGEVRNPYYGAANLHCGELSASASQSSKPAMHGAQHEH